jgi:hypothetical protein
MELGFHCVRTHWIRGFTAFCGRGRLRLRGYATRGTEDWGSVRWRARWGGVCEGFSL